MNLDLVQTQGTPAVQKVVAQKIDYEAKKTYQPPAKKGFSLFDREKP